MTYETLTRAKLRTRASSRKLTRKPVILAAAALIATSALGLTLGNLVPFAAAETAATQPTIDMPYGRAPLSFADLVAKVSPAVVSINVKGDAKVAENDEADPGHARSSRGQPALRFLQAVPQGHAAAASRSRRRRSGARLRLLHLAGRLRRDQQPRGRGCRGHHRHDGERRQISGDAGRDRSAHRRCPDQGQGRRQDVPVRRVLEEGSARGRLGSCGWQSVRPWRHGDGRHHLGA